MELDKLDQEVKNKKYILEEKMAQADKAKTDYEIMESHLDDVDKELTKKEDKINAKENELAQRLIALEAREKVAKENEVKIEEEWIRIQAEHLRIDNKIELNSLKKEIANARPK